VGAATHAHWDGTTWTSSPAPVDGVETTLFGVSATGSGGVWAVGSQGAILHHP
jgi:hypothetical protein